MSEPKKVLIVAHSSQRGGAEYCLDTALRYLDRQRFDATVVFPFEGPMVDVTRSYGYNVKVLPLMYWLYCHKDAWYWRNLLGRSWVNVLRLYNVIRRTGAELVYTSTSAIFESAIAARLARVPHVWHVHEVLGNGNQMHQLFPLPVMKRLIYRLSARIVFESHSARQVFETSTPGGRSVVVYNSLRLAEGGTPQSAFPTENFLMEQGNDRDRFGLNLHDRVVGFVGQFIERKNPLLLIRSLAHIEHHARLKCLFVGQGPLETAMRNEIARLGLDEVCQIVPFQEGIAPVMRAIDLLVLPSRQESFGLVLIEAASRGKPAVACRCEGPSEIIVDGETGLLVSQDSEGELVGAIQRLLADDALRSSMGEAAARRTAAIFCAKANTRRLEDLIIELINSRERRRRPPCDAVLAVHGGATRVEEIQSLIETAI